MIKQVKKSKFKKTVAIYLAMMILLETLHPMSMYALTSGPKQPEFTAFTPIGTSDMVSLTSGNFNYNIPIMDVGGYPLNLAYDSGVTMDQEASWVGLGWNLNVGQISRQVRGLPDDFRGDQIRYENHLRDNITVGTNFNLKPAVLGNDSPFSLGLGVQYNNYEGITFHPSVGISYSIAGLQVGAQLSSGVGEGATLTPSVGISNTIGAVNLSLGLSAGLSSRKGLENMGMSVSASTKKVDENKEKDKNGKATYSVNNDPNEPQQSLGSMSGSLSFNNQSYTPTKRIAFLNKSKSFNASVGGEVYGVEIDGSVNGYGSFQSIEDSYRNRLVPAYGYENTQYKNNTEGVLDFNREKEQAISKNTNALPVTNYTYDIYNIEGQGVSGMFRPFRSQVGYLYNDNVTDKSSSKSFGAELGLGNLVHGGVNFSSSPTVSSTGLWINNNYALPLFAESNTDRKKPLYEQSAFKLVGELDVDHESGIYSTRLLSNKALRLQLDGLEFDRKVVPNYRVKNLDASGVSHYGDNPVLTKIKREGRLLRNQVIQKITNREADNKFIFKNHNALSYHTVGVKVLQTDGTTYVFGQSVYNKTKIEATFDASKTSNAIDYANGLITYGHTNLSENGRANSDQYVNKITTPNYAHSYLITSVLSSDYEDIDNNGPTDKDLGSYTKFGYDNSIGNYNWRIPYGLMQASFNEGLKGSGKDQKGNYIYGVKELTYLNKIETKTHVAFIDLENRSDAMGVLGEHGGRDNSQAMKCIKSIRLYSKAELDFDSTGNALDPGIGSTVKPIKTAHFEYDYSLCKNIPSSSTYNTLTKKGEGKLTLKKVYFTYRASNMGKYTPYKFDYAESNSDLNPDYAIKAFDIWGNYNPLTTAPTTTEFPFVKQDQTTVVNQDNADKNTSVWTLKNITLPSGGKLSIQTESDDYKYVQNKKAMQMFKVLGVGTSNNSNFMDNKLYLGNGPTNYLYVKVNDSSLQNQDFIDRYLSENINKPIYFKFLLNMYEGSSDFVCGYVEIDQSLKDQMKVTNGIAAIPVKLLRMEGGTNGGDFVNPIAKAGWGFGRTFLNRQVYGDGGAETNTNFVAIVKDLIGSIKAMTEIYKGPNKFLMDKGCARNFNPEQSWIRLENPNGKKFGGGLRVKKIQLSDNWDVMNSVETNSVYKDIFEEKYGQDYSYTLEDGFSSSGVASFEPNASPENPFVEPFYGKDGNYADRIGSPRENNYTEKPFGETFFPSPKVTYSRVTVSNLDKHGENGTNSVVKKHATGKVITEHYTTKNFPTIVDYTEIDLHYDKMQSPLLQMLHVRSVDHLTASQGFSIETNDMDGKVKSEKVFAEGQVEPISKVVYKYNTDSSGRLNNKLTTINSKGIAAINLLGVEYDVINDFNESNSVTTSMGRNLNVAAFLIGIFPLYVPMVIPRDGYHETILRTATTTKVVHKTGILLEKIAYDLGSRVSTKNLAWDAKSGQVLLTETINEFDDKYYSFNYPAYWYYDGMGMASENIDLKGILKPNGSYFSLSGLADTTVLTPYFKIGDELVFENAFHNKTKLWVKGYNTAKDHIQLINKNGDLITQSNIQGLKFKIVRSGNRNQQMTSMASVTSMFNPLGDDPIHPSDITDLTFGYQAGDRKVINASAVEYSDDWKSQCENGLPNEEGIAINDNPSHPVNPFIFNLKGDWRAIKSYAYLTGRNNFTTSNRRKTGYFANFSSFYKTNNTTWTIDSTSWTFASKVSKYSPYGVELENKDALKRYSSAQYGYNYKLPVAVSSNAQYREIGYDGFEDYTDYFFPSVLKPHFGFSQSLNNDVIITSEKSHTGNNSIAVKPGKSAVFTRKIGGCKSGSTNPTGKQIVKR